MKKERTKGIGLRTYIVGMITLCVLLLGLLMYTTGVLGNTYRHMTNYSELLRQWDVMAVQVEQARFHMTGQMYLYIQDVSTECAEEYFSQARGIRQAETALKRFDDDLKLPNSADALAAVVEMSDALTQYEQYAMKLAAQAAGINDADLPIRLRKIELTELDAALSVEGKMEKVRQTVYGPAYQELYSSYLSQFKSFRETVAQELEQRQQTEMESISHSMKHQRWCILLMTLLVAGGSAGLIQGILLPVEKYNESIQNGEPFCPEGVRELRRLALNYNEAYNKDVESKGQLLVRAEHDPMTGLMNQGAYDLLKRKLSESTDQLALLVIDVDQFKSVNDNYGHEMGNKALKKIASMLRHAFHPDDYVIRYGGDEFVVIARNVKASDADALERKIGRINERLMRPDDGLPPVSLSVGAAFSEHGFQEEVFRHADQAMYQVKRKGRCGFCVYDKLEEQTQVVQTSRGVERKPKILIVDDSEMNREILSSMLEDSYEIYQATNGQQGIELVERDGHDLSLLLLDLMMPECDGYEVLTYLGNHHWNEILPVIVISAETDPASINRAYDLGAVDYIGRPFDAQMVRRRVNNTVGLHLKQKRLADIVAQQIQEQTDSYNTMMSILSQVVEFRNQESGLHVLHITEITEMLLDCLMKKTSAYGLTPEDAQRITSASALHDIGKITIPDAIINKPGRLTDEEMAVMKTHSAAGAAMLEQVEGYENDRLIRSAWEICRWHHERYDGRGYPDGLVGDQIPISAQLVSVADVYDALTSERCYKPPFTHEKALSMILEGACGAFNPLLMDCLKEIADKLPKLLKDDTGRRRRNRDSAHVMQEMSRHRELVLSNKMLYRIQYEKCRADYLEETSGNWSFCYRSDADELTLSAELAQILKMDEVICAPKTDRKLKTRFNWTSSNWDVVSTNATVDNPEITTAISFIGSNEMYQCRIRTIWSVEEAPQYLGVVGVILHSWSKTEQ